MSGRGREAQSQHKLLHVGSQHGINELIISGAGGENPAAVREGREEHVQVSTNVCLQKGRHMW